MSENRKGEASPADAGGEDAPSDAAEAKASSGAGLVEGADASTPSESGPQPRTTGEVRITPAPPLVCASCERANPADARFCMSCAHPVGEGQPILELRKDADPLVGRVIAGRYRIDEVIGRGGMGVVYRVEHVRMGKLMAMKLLHGDLARDKEVVRRFRREAEAVSKLDHPNTVQVFDFGESDGMTWLVMELLSGKDLGGVLLETATLDFGRAARIAWQIASSVHQAHERGIVHRDLKPENVRVLSDRAESDFVKVLDFGLAKLRETEEQKRASITREGFLVGTPYYMAPEHIRGDAVDARSDVYALGAVLYKCVTGMPPFWAPTPVGVLTKHLTEDPQPPRKRSPRKDLPPDADRIILKALEKSPADRHQSMDELRGDLARYLGSIGDEPISGRITLPAPSPPVPTDSGRRVAVATRDEFDRYESTMRVQGVLVTLLLVLGVVGGVAAAWWSYGHTTLFAAPADEESEPNDAVVDADVLPVDVAVSGHLGVRRDVSHGDTDLYALADLPAGTRWVSVECSGLPNADVLLDVYVRGRTDPIFVLDGAGWGQPEGAPNLPVDPSADYLFQVREEIEPGRYPTENLSDPYTIRVAPVTLEDDVEREPNDTTATATEVLVPSAWRGWVSWGSDADVYCTPADAPPLTITLDAIQTLDLVLTIDDRTTGRSTEVNTGGAGEPESTRTEGGGVCARVSAASAATRSDPHRTYTIHFAAAE